MQRTELEPHEKLAKALAERLSEMDANAVRELVSGTLYGQDLASEPDNVVKAAVAIMVGTLPDAVRRHRALAEHPDGMVSHASPLTGTRLRSLRPYGFRLVYHGGGDPRDALQEYHRKNSELVSDEQMDQFSRELETCSIKVVPEDWDTWR